MFLSISISLKLSFRDSPSSSVGTSFFSCSPHKPHHCSQPRTAPPPTLVFERLVPGRFLLRFPNPWPLAQSPQESGEQGDLCHSGANPLGEGPARPRPGGKRHRPPTPVGGPRRVHPGQPRPARGPVRPPTNAPAALTSPRRRLPRVPARSRSRLLRDVSPPAAQSSSTAAGIRWAVVRLRLLEPSYSLLLSNACTQTDQCRPSCPSVPPSRQSNPSYMAAPLLNGARQRRRFPHLYPAPAGPKSRLQGA